MVFLCDSQLCLIFIFFEKQSLFYHRKLGSSYSFFFKFSANVTKKFCAIFICVKSSKCLTLNVNMFQRTEFGRFLVLVCCWIVHPCLNGVENNSDLYLIEFDVKPLKCLD